MDVPHVEDHTEDKPRHGPNTVFLQSRTEFADKKGTWHARGEKIPTAEVDGDRGAAGRVLGKLLSFKGTQAEKTSHCRRKTRVYLRPSHSQHQEPAEPGPQNAEGERARPTRAVSRLETLAGNGGCLQPKCGSRGPGKTAGGACWVHTRTQWPCRIETLKLPQNKDDGSDPTTQGGLIRQPHLIAGVHDAYRQLLFCLKASYRHRNRARLRNT